MRAEPAAGLLVEGVGLEPDRHPIVDGRRCVLALGEEHSCALLDNHVVKCWGRNNVGNLGLGDVATRGDAAGEMADSLPAVDL